MLVCIYRFLSINEILTKVNKTSKTMRNVFGYDKSLMHAPIVYANRLGYSDIDHILTVADKAIFSIDTKEDAAKWKKETDKFPKKDVRLSKLFVFEELSLKNVHIFMDPRELTAVTT